MEIIFKFHFNYYFFFHFDLKMHGVSIKVETSDIKCMLSVQLLLTSTCPLRLKNNFYQEFKRYFSLKTQTHLTRRSSTYKARISSD